MNMEKIFHQYLNRNTKNGKIILNNFQNNPFTSVLKVKSSSTKWYYIGKIFLNLSLYYLILNFGLKFVKSHEVYKTLKCASEKSKFTNKKEIELNNLEKRAAIVQHNANEPIEDRFSAYELKNFQGYFLSVLDGHGGYQMAEFANERLYRYFDEIYKEMIEKNKNMKEDEVVVNSLLKTFDKIEKEYHNIAINLYREGEDKIATVGSCVLVVLVSSDKIYTAQLGDSKAKLYRKSEDKNKPYDVIKLTNTHNSEKKREQEILFSQFKDEKDIVVCKRPNNKVCYVKGRLQPTRVFIYLIKLNILFSH
jgi:hypothetical protein